MLIVVSPTRLGSRVQWRSMHHLSVRSFTLVVSNGGHEAIRNVGGDLPSSSLVCIVYFTRLGDAHHSQVSSDGSLPSSKGSYTREFLNSVPPSTSSICSGVYSPHFSTALHAHAKADG